MKRAVDTGLSKHGRPFEWVIVSNGICYTSSGPMYADGTPETGPIRTQAKLTLDNLAKQLKAAGGTMADVVQVMLYVTDRAHIDPITEEWAVAFPKPFPNRATVIVEEIGIRGVGLVIMATAHLGAGGRATKATKASRAPNRTAKRPAKRSAKKRASRKR
jgi:enamine deaminase RidA (YjgF/YER057c/UK114 family)